MAAALGFRIGIDASKFCTNVKRCFYIYVDLLRDRTIQDIENRIKLMLQIDTSVWLLNGNFYLPPSENVRLLCSGDILKVVEQSEDGLDLNTCFAEVNENIVQTFSREKKKRKKKNLHDNSENDSNRMYIEKHSEAISKTAEEEINVSSSFYEQRETSTLILNDTCNEYLKENEVKSSNCLESLKISDDFNKDSAEINDMSFSSHKNMGKSVQEDTGEPRLDIDFERPKKRRRVRKHKKKQMPSIEHHHVTPPSFKQKVYTTHTDVSRSHIRFNEEEDGKTSELCKSTGNDNDAMMLDSSLAENECVIGNFHSTKWDVKTNSNNLVTNGTTNGRITNGTSDSGEAFAKLLSFERNSTPLVFHRKRNEYEAISQQLQIGNENLDISEYPRLSEIPKEGDIIAFKMLKMDEFYTPKISEYIIARVLSLSKSSFQLSLLVLGGDQYKTPKGKFDLEEAEIDESNNEYLELNWNELCDTRLLYP